MSEQTSKTLLSVITPAFNETENLKDLHALLCDNLDASDITWEWLIIDDHSTDATFSVASDIARNNRNVQVLRFSRNFGSHMAITCGLNKARGHCAVVLAADLQDPPKIITELLAQWRNGAHIVWAVRRQREATSRVTLACSRLYYWIMRHMVGLKEMPPEGADFFLVDRKVINAFQQFNEKNNNVFSLLAWLGFRQKYIYYDKQARTKGKSGWTLRKQVKLLLDSITSYSYFPIRIFSATGIIIALMGFIYASIICFRAFFHTPYTLHGWPSLIVVVLILGGLQMIMLGILGEYLWRALDQTRKRPAYLIEDEYNTPAQPLASARIADNTPTAKITVRALDVHDA